MFKLLRLIPLLLLALTLTTPAQAASWQGEFTLTAYSADGRDRKSVV